MGVLVVRPALWRHKVPRLVDERLILSSFHDVVLEIGAQPNFRLLEPWGELSLFEGRDAYRLQVPQLKVHPHNFESIDIPGLYPAGYLAENLGISVLGMHATCFPIVADIERKIAARTGA